MLSAKRRSAKEIPRVQATERSTRGGQGTEAEFCRDALICVFTSSGASVLGWWVSSVRCCPFRQLLSGQFMLFSAGVSTRPVAWWVGSFEVCGNEVAVLLHNPAAHGLCRCVGRILGEGLVEQLLLRELLDRREVLKRSLTKM